MKKIIFTGSLAVVLTAGVNMSASAALASDAVLNFEPGVLAHVGSGSHGLSIASGSYFGLDTDSSGRVSLLGESVPVLQNEGLFIGTVQLASGSHRGPVDGSENPGIDNPWSYFGSTGMHYASTPTNVLTDDGNGNATVDFSGWGVTWGGIPAINLGGGLQDCGTANDGICVDPVNGTDIAGTFDNGTGIATVTCAVDCAEGDTYTLDYTAIVPQADASNFGGVLYVLHLEGTIASVPVPAAVWLFGSGLLSLAGVARCRRLPVSG